jgi:hypothetical protein
VRRCLEQFFNAIKDIDFYGLYTQACTTNDDDQRRFRPLALSMTNKQAAPPILQLLRPLLKQLRDRVPEPRQRAGSTARQHECHNPLQVVTLQQRHHEALKSSLIAIVLVPIKSTAMVVAHQHEERSVHSAWLLSYVLLLIKIVKLSIYGS